MIPLLDLAIVSRFTAISPGAELRWAPPHNRERAAQVMPRASDPARVAGTGQPAATVFRPSVSTASFVNVPQQDVGFRGALSTDRRTIEMQRRIGVDAKYHYEVWAYRQSEVDAICRNILFSLVYRPMTVNIGGKPFNFRIDADNPQYDSFAQDDDNTIRIYSLTFDFTVLDAFWALDETVNTVIYPVLQYYEEITNGSPILLETVRLIPEGY